MQLGCREVGDDDIDDLEQYATEFESMVRSIPVPVGIRVNPVRVDSGVKVGPAILYGRIPQAQYDAWVLRRERNHRRVKRHKNAGSPIRRLAFGDSAESVRNAPKGVDELRARVIRQIAAQDAENRRREKESEAKKAQDTETAMKLDEIQNSLLKLMDEINSIRKGLSV